MTSFPANGKTCLYRKRCNTDVWLLLNNNLLANSKCGYWKGYYDLILVFNSNQRSIMHCFRYNEILPLAGNDVIRLSSLGAP